MTVSLAQYTELQMFKAEHHELYWKLFALWLDWWVCSRASERPQDNLPDLHANEMLDWYHTRYVRMRPPSAPNFIALWNYGAI